MSFKKRSTYACNPHTARGASTKLSGTADGRVVYTNGKTVIIRDVVNPSLSFTYSEHAHTVNIARISPSGYYCASADVSGTVRIWDTSFLKTGNAFPPTSVEPPVLKAEYRPMAGRVNDLAWDGETKRIILVGESRDKFAAAIQMDTGAGAGEISGHSKIINAVSIRHQRPFKAVTASDDNSVIFYSGVPFKYEKIIRTHSRFVQDVKFSPNGDLFASVGSDGKAFFYDGKTAETVQELADAHKGSITAGSWSPDGKSLLTSSADCTVKLWDVESAKAVVTWTMGSTIQYQQVGNTWVGGSLDDGIVSLSLGGELNVFDKRNGDGPAKVIYGSSKAITSAAVAPDGTFFAGSYDGRITAFDNHGNASQLDPESGHGTQVVGMACGDQSLVTVGYDDKLREIDIGSKTYGPTAEAVSSQPRGITAVPHSQTSFVITEDNIIAYESGQEAFKLSVNYEPTAVASSVDGATVAVGGADNRVYLYAWDGKQLKEGGKLEANTSKITALSFSPDGQLLAAGDSGGKLLPYNLGDRSVKTARWIAHAGRINSIVWTPDSKCCISGSLDSHIYVWSIDKPNKTVPIRNAVPGGVNVVGLLGPNVIAGAGSDGCVRTWEVTFPS